MFQQMVPVLDTALFERFVAQVRKGDSVQVTVETEWHEQRYATYLMDFVTISQTISASIAQLPEPVVSLTR